MEQTSADAERLCKAAIEAVHRGQPEAARRLIEPLAATAFAPWLLLAQVRLAAGDVDGAEQAIDRLLAIEPRHLGALIVKGDCRTQQRDSRAATAFYNSALAVADGLDSVPQGLAAALRRVQDAVRRNLAEYEASLRGALSDAGIATSPWIAEALDILTGRRQIYPQEPLTFYYPGLPLSQFYDPAQFEWAAAIESRTDAIRDELVAVMRDGDGFHPYVEQDPNRPARPSATMVADPGWSAYYLWRDGVPVAGQADRCPATMAALALAPMPVIPHRAPMALFSLMKPGMHIIPHHGFLNTRLICHLPLIVPDGCTLRVGNAERTWSERELVIFDDSIEHEARNGGTSTRVVLLFEVWRPEIDEHEREALTLLFAHIADYSEG